MRGRLRSGFLLAGFGIVLAMQGCVSDGGVEGETAAAPRESAFLTPFRSFRGAKLYSTGTAALNAGDLPRAIADLSEASRLAPEASEIQNHLGLAYWANGETGRARSAFERSLELDCENEAAQQNLAGLEAAKGVSPATGSTAAAP